MGATTGMGGQTNESRGTGGLGDAEENRDGGGEDADKEEGEGRVTDRLGALCGALLASKDEAEADDTGDGAPPTIVCVGDDEPRL